MHSWFDDAPLAYHELDASGILARVNKAQCDLFGLRPQDMIGRPIWEFAKMYAGQKEQSRNTVLRHMRGPEDPPPIKRSFRTVTGSILVFSIHAKLMRDESGAVTGMRSAMIDQTAAWRLNRCLTKERNLLHALMDQSSDHIYFKDHHGFTLVNGSLARALGRSNPSELVGRSDQDYFTAEHAETFRDERALIRRASSRLTKGRKGDVA